MTKKIVLTIIIAILFAGAITGAYFGYEKLSEKYSPSTTAPAGGKEEYKNFSDRKSTRLNSSHRV